MKSPNLNIFILQNIYNAATDSSLFNLKIARVDLSRFEMVQVSTAEAQIRPTTIPTLAQLTVAGRYAQSNFMVSEVNAVSAPKNLPNVHHLTFATD